MHEGIAEAPARRLWNQDVGNWGWVPQSEEGRRRQMGRRGALRPRQTGDHDVLFPRLWRSRHHIDASDGDPPAPQAQTGVYLLLRQTETKRLTPGDGAPLPGSQF